MHVSNSGEQIPKRARHNSQDCRFPVLVTKIKVWSGGHRFLNSCFSEFSFPVLDSQYKPRDDDGLEITQFSFLIPRFTVLASKRPLQIRPADRDLYINPAAELSDKIEVLSGQRRPDEGRGAQARDRGLDGHLKYLPPLLKEKTCLSRVQNVTPCDISLEFLSGTRMRRSFLGSAAWYGTPNAPSSGWIRGWPR